jgi:hypothetical protein
MPSGFDEIKRRDGVDRNATSQSRLRGTKSLDNLTRMAAESARIDREKRLLGSIREIYTKIGS